MDFQGKATPLTPAGLAAAATRLGVGTPEIWAVVSVETHGAGFLPDRRPQILFERHIFARLTASRFNASHPGISSPTPGGYGPSGTNQYLRLAQAISLDRQAALQSASWGMAQIMGSNFAAAGFPGVEQMVASMCASEDAQLDAMASFLLQTRLARFLAVHDWTAFARGYNGPAYAGNRYDTQLNGSYRKALAGAVPDLHIRAAQILLGFRHLDCHRVDGMPGPATTSAIQSFQAAQGIEPTGIVDDGLLTLLQAA